MWEIKKKFFPKIKKKLKWFLTDESGNITKKDALGLGVGVMLLSGIDEVSAGCSLVGSYTPSSDTHYCSSVIVNHASWIVNWHYSSTPWYLWWDLKWTYTPSSDTHTVSHSNHSNHSSHWSWGWC